MSESNRKDPREVSVRRPAAAHAVLRERVTGQLSRLEHVITELRGALETSRLENRMLTDDRDRLQEALLRADVAEIGLATAESRWRASATDERGLKSSHDRLAKENGELADRCRRFQASLAQERDEHGETKLEIACLQEQVDELQSIVALLTRD